MANYNNTDEKKVFIGVDTGLSSSKTTIKQHHGNDRHRFQSASATHTMQLEAGVSLAPAYDDRVTSISVIAKSAITNTRGTPTTITSGSASGPDTLSPTDPAIAEALSNSNPNSSKVSFVGVSGRQTIPLMYNKEAEPVLTGKAGIALGVAASTVNPASLTAVAAAHNPSLKIQDAPFAVNKTGMGFMLNGGIELKEGKLPGLGLNGSFMQGAGAFLSDATLEAFKTVPLNQYGTTLKIKVGAVTGATNIYPHQPMGNGSLSESTVNHGLGGTFGIVFTPGNGRNK